MDALLSNHATFGKSYSARTLSLFCLLVLQLTTPTYAIFTLPEVIFRPSVITNCSMPLLECPISSTARAIREFCVMGFQTDRCPPGTHYGCGEDVTYGYLTEGCFTRNICKPGSSNRITVDIRRNVTDLECVLCDDTHYQPFPADSLKDSLRGCSMERKSFTMKQQSGHMMLVHTGWPTRPDIYSCNYAQGYSDALQNMYCDVTTPCACTNNIFCLDREAPELLPDGSCDGRCAIVRDMKRNYSCSSYESEEIWDEELGAELKKFILVVIFISSVCFFCFSYFLARRRYRKKEVKGSSRRGSLVPLERVSLTKRRVSFSPESELTKCNSGIKASELVIDPVIEADEEDEEVPNVKGNSDNDNAVLDGTDVDQQAVKVDTTEGEVPQSRALQDRPKWYLTIPEDEEMSVERASVDKYGDTDRELVREKKHQKFYTVEEIPIDVIKDKRINRVTDSNSNTGFTDEYKLPFAETFPSVHQKYQYMLDLKKRIEETIIQTACMEKVEECKCGNRAIETTTPTVLRFLVRGTARFDPVRLIENATDTNMSRTQVNTVEKKESSVAVLDERKQSLQLMENTQEATACQHNNLDDKADNHLKDNRPTAAINNTNISESVVFVDSEDNSRHTEQINKTSNFMSPVARVNKTMLIEGTNTGFQYEHFIDTLCNSVTASIQLIIVEIEDTSSFPVEAIVEYINSFRNLGQEIFETNTLVICDIVHHIGEFRSLQLDIVDALTGNFGTSHSFEKNIDFGSKGHNISRKVSAFIEKRLIRAFQGIHSILQDIRTTTENEHEHRRTQTLVQEIDQYLRQTAQPVEKLKNSVGI